MSAYYNEIEPFAADWLEGLIRKGLIADGTVDRRNILDVEPADLAGFTQCHFFAGIGGWSLALRLAGWPDDRHVWTGSCPCQPFSLAGSLGSSNDERHLWPAFFRLVQKCIPPTIFGEQVAGAGGAAWWDHVAGDLETINYAVAAGVIPAGAVGARHRRERLFWCAAHPNGHGLQGIKNTGRITQERPWGTQQLEGLLQEIQRTSLPSGRAGALVDGVSGRVGRLRAYGNAIVPQVAAEFIGAYCEC